MKPHLRHTKVWSILLLVLLCGSSLAVLPRVAHADPTYYVDDTFDNAAGNNALSGWGIPYGGSLVSLGSGNYGLQLTNTQSQSGVVTDDRSMSYLGSGNYIVEERVSIGDVTIFKPIPQILYTNTVVGEVDVSNGQFVLQDGTTNVVLPGGNAISDNTWYTVFVDVNTGTGQYTAWVGTEPSSPTYYNFLNASSAITDIAYILQSDEPNGITLDYLKVYDATGGSPTPTPTPTNTPTPTPTNTPTPTPTPTNTPTPTPTPTSTPTPTPTPNPGGSHDATVTSSVYTVNSVNDTISNVPQGTTVGAFIGNLVAAQGATIADYKDNGTTQRSSTDQVYTNDVLIVTAPDGTTTKAYTVSVVIITYNASVDDTFDNAAGNNGLAGWGIINGSVINIGGSNYALQLTNPNPFSVSDTRGTSGPLQGSEVDISFQFNLANNQLAVALPQLFDTSTEFGELDIVNGQLTLQHDGTSTVIPGGNTIASDTWYTVSLNLNTTTGQYTAWVGSKPASPTFYNFIASANALTQVGFDLPANDTSGLILDNLEIGTTTYTVAPAPPSSVTDITSSTYQVNDGTNTLTVYNGTTLNMVNTQVTALKAGTFMVYQSDGTTQITNPVTPIVSGDKLTVRAQDGIETRTYTINVVVNTNATVSSAVYTVNNTANTISNVDANTTVSVFAALLQPAQGATIQLYEADGKTPLVTGTMSTGDKVFVTAQDGVTTRTYTVQLIVEKVQATFYVDPTNGNDANNGSITSPFQTITKAQSVVQGINSNMTGDIVVYLRGGTYPLSSTLSFGTVDSGTNGYNVVYRTYPGEHPTISGGQTIAGWTLVDPTKDIYEASAQGLNFRQLYVAGVPATLARWPNVGTMNRVAGWNDGQNNTQALGQVLLHSSDNVPQFSNDSNNPVEIVVQARWEDIVLPITGMQNNGTIDTVSIAQPNANAIDNRPGEVREAGNPYYFQNAYAFLDAPGEWYLDSATNQLFYIPLPGQNMSTVQIVAPKVETLVQFQGSIGSPVHNVVMQGVTIQDGTWLAPITNGSYSETWQHFNNWTDEQPIRPAAGVLFKDAVNDQLLDSTVKNVGGDGVELYEAQNDTVEGNAIYNVSKNGIQAGTFDYEKYTNYPGSYTYGYFTPTNPALLTSNLTLSNNYITQVGVDYMDSEGIKAGWLTNTTIAHNDIINVPYTGIYLGWGKPNQDPTKALHDNLVQANDISHPNNDLVDGGAIYCYGEHLRDVIDSNYMHDGWYTQYEDISNILSVYIDDGGSGMTVTNNVWRNMQSGFQNGPLSALEKQGAGNTFNNNDSQDPTIIANAGLQPQYQAMRLAPIADPYPWNNYTGQSITVSLSYAPGWTIYYTLDGSQPTTNSTRYGGPITLTATSPVTVNAIAVDGSGDVSQVFSGVYQTIDIALQENFANSSETPIIDGTTRGVAISGDTGFAWTGYTPGYGSPINPPGGTYQEGNVLYDTDQTIVLDTGAGPHILFIGNASATLSGNVSGAYAYTIFSSKGNTTPTTSVPNMQNGTLRMQFDGGSDSWLPAGTPTSAPWPENVRFMVRDAQGNWYLSTSSTALTIQAAGIVNEPINTLSWQPLTTGSQSILNASPSTDATQGAISAQSTTGTPDWSGITGFGIYIDSNANSYSYFRFMSLAMIEGPH